MRADRLSELRKVRAARIGTGSQGYADLDHIRQEMDYAFKFYEQRRDWPLVDVTAKSIEEAAAEVVALLGKPVRHEDTLDAV